MNVHHLELFYYVARHGGISEAVRNIPYGIQQPAVSAQIIQLEQYLGVTLFHRRPFELTAAGTELYHFIEPFFGRIEEVTRKLQGGTAHHIRIGASEIVMREHLPQIASLVRAQYPKLTFTLREGYQPQVEAWLEKQEVDLALTLLGDKLPTYLSNKPVLRLPLILIVPKKSPLKSADDLWKQDSIKDALITLPAYEELCRHFQQGLTKKGVDWLPSIEVSSLRLIETYVANGYGIGLFLEVPTLKLAPELRVLPLPDFEPVVFGALWRGKVTPLIQCFLEAIGLRAKELLKAFPTDSERFIPNIGRKPA